MALRLIMKKYAADPDIGFPTNSILQPFGLHTSIPTVSESKSNFEKIKQDVYLCRIEANYGYHIKQKFDIDSFKDKNGYKTFLSSHLKLVLQAWLPRYLEAF